jgi:hypothetical protein
MIIYDVEPQSCGASVGDGGGVCGFLKKARHSGQRLSKETTRVVLSTCVGRAVTLAATT